MAKIKGKQLSLTDDQFEILDDADPTKILDFQLSSITGGNTRVWTAQDQDGIITVQADATLTEGSIPYVDSTGKITQDNTNFFRDNTNNRVGFGTNTPTATLDILGDALYTFTATGNDQNHIRVVTDASANADIKAIDMVYTTGAIATGDREAALLVEIDASLATGGMFVALDVATIPGSSSICAVEAGAQVQPLLHLSGGFTDMDSALVLAVDRRAEFISAGSDIVLFVADNDTVTIGHVSRFQQISFDLDTVSSGAGIDPLFEFSTGVGTWATFNPTDGTSAFRNSGNIVWRNSDIPSWAVGTGTEFLIRITRQRNSLSTTPIENLVQISVVTEYAWNTDGTIESAGIDLGFSTPVTSILDEDTLVSDSATALATQQSIKAYIDNADAAFQTTFVFRPTGSAGDNVYTTWASLITAIGLVEGPKIVYLDDSASGAAVVIPAGTYDMTDVILTGKTDGTTASTDFVTVTLTDGVIFNNLSDITNNLAITSQNTTTPVISLGNNKSLRLTQNIFIINTGSQPFVEYDLSAGNSFLIMNEYITLFPAGHEIVGSTGTVGFLKIKMIGGFNQINTDSLRDVISANTITIEAAGTYQLISATQTNLNTAFTTVLLTDANFLGFDDSTSNLNSDQAQDALVELAPTLTTIDVDDTPHTAVLSSMFSTIIADNSTGAGSPAAITINLPNAASSTGRILVIKKIDADANTVTIDGDTAETIDDATTQVLANQFDSIAIQSDGTEWWIVG